MYGSQNYLEAQHHAKYGNHDGAGGGGDTQIGKMNPFAYSENKSKYKERPSEQDVEGIDVEIVYKIAQQNAFQMCFQQFWRKGQQGLPIERFDFSDP